jgi:hypothetical protein
MQTSNLIETIATKALVNHKQQLGTLVLATSVTALNTTFHVRPSSLRPTALYLRNSTQLQASTLVDIVVIDRLISPGRFVVKYLFRSSRVNRRRNLSFSVNEVAIIPSLAAPFANNQRVFAAAN